MDVSRIIKSVVAIIIAVVLTGGFLYVKLKKDQSDNQVIQQVAMPTGSEKTAEEKLQESISASANSNIEVKPEVLSSLTAPKDKK